MWWDKGDFRLKLKKEDKNILFTLIFFGALFLIGLGTLYYYGALDSDKIEAESRAEAFCSRAGHSGVDYIEKYGVKYIFNCTSDVVAYYDEEFNSGFIKWPVE